MSRRPGPARPRSRGPAARVLPPRMAAMFSPYRRVLGMPGALAFSASGLVARLPISMVSLGIVLLVSTRTGSYSLAGSVSASYLIANALCAVLQARLVDRVGQRRGGPPARRGFWLGVVVFFVAGGR